MSARVSEMNEQAPEQLRASLHCLHVNLGHPNNATLIRVLKHGGASQRAIDAARAFCCELCETKQRPKPAHPAQVERVTEFNRRIGIDVKYLQGWKANQKIPAVNIVDYASSFQIMVPLQAPKENAELIRKALWEHWIAWAGQPSEIVVDPARANLSEAFTTPQELRGSTICTTAAEAHWQLGKVEVHGGWFNRVLDKVIAECAPHDRATWEACVSAAHSKNELIQVYGMTPSQFVFGRNPRIPHALMDEPLEVVPATASLYEEQVAKAVFIRQAARKAVLEMQDDKFELSSTP